MINYHDYASCGVIKTADGKASVQLLWAVPAFTKHTDSKILFLDTLVIVSGGDYSTPGTVDIYSYKDNNCSLGTPLPYALQFAATVPFGDSFVIAGGYRMDSFTDSIGKCCCHGEQKLNSSWTRGRFFCREPAKLRSRQG
jgi:hypothetical protein